MSRIAPRRLAALGTWHWGLVAVAGLAVAYAGWHQLASAETAVRVPAPAEVPVHVGAVEKMPFPLVLNGLGTVQATNTVTVRSRVDGQIEKVAFEEGQIVKEGDLLVQIDPAPFKASLDQATAKLAQDQASLTNAKQDLARTTILSKQGDATLQLLDQRTANVASLTAQVQADQAAIESANVQLAYTTIRSPLTGRAGFRLIDSGNIVHATDQNGMLTITQLQPISVVFTAPEQELPAISDALKIGAAEGHGLQLGRQEGAGRRHAQADRQPGRRGERHHSPEGQLRQRGQCAVARLVGHARGCWYRRCPTPSWSPTTPCSAARTVSTSTS